MCDIYSPEKVVQLVLPAATYVHGHSIMHCKAPVWVKPNLGEAQLGHQASAEYKLRFYLGL